MTKSHKYCAWIEEIYQGKDFQSVIFTGFNISDLSPMAIMTSHFVDDIDHSFLEQHHKANKIIGGRPYFDYKSLIKVYMYAI